MVSQEVTEVSLREVQLLHRSRICITAVTKALLFTTIEKKLQEFLSDEDFELYAVPVVNMDWEQADRLRSDIEKA